jgi:poly-gamma-glutamate capsule biosynthesis protein CapA/YwtB (metallophosphatase superfamily)
MRRISPAAVFFSLLCGCGHPAAGPVLRSTDLSSTSSNPGGTPRASFPANVPTASLTDPSATAPAPSATASETPQSGGADLAFVGDIMLGRSLGERIAAGGGEAVFASVEPILQSADIAVGNLECAIGEGGTPAPKAFTFLAPPPSASLIRAAGVDLVTLANNHILDYGLDTFVQTREYLKENEIRYVGAGANDDEAHQPVILDAGGFHFAFLAYAEVPVEYLSGFDPRSWTAGPRKPGIAWADDDRIRSDIRALGESSADVVIVLYHFGTEGMAAPNGRQVRLAHLAVDSGADLVIGTHTHVVQSEEDYRDGRIFYSLGNFVFDGFTGASNRGVILWITLSGEREISTRLIPVMIVDGIPRIGE